MSGFDQSSIAVSMPTVVGADAALGGPYKIKPSEAFSGGLMTVSGLTGETISVQTSPDGYWGAPASPSFYRTDWQGTQPLYGSARTNLYRGSQSFDDAASWTPTGLGTITANTVTAPDGTLTAEKLPESAGGTAHKVVSAAPSGSTAVQTTFSVYAKAAERNWIAIEIGGTVGAFVNLATGSKGTEYGTPGTIVRDVGNGWYRISVTTIPAVNAVLALYVCNGHDSSSYSGTTGSGIYVWGTQLETGTAATPYIPTTTAAVTITDYTLSNGVITVSPPPLAGATLSYDNGVLPSPYYIFATGDGTRTAFAYDGVWGTLSANSGKGNGIWQVDLRGAQAYRLVKSAGSETATVNMTLKRDALQYKNTAGTWSVT